MPSAMLGAFATSGLAQNQRLPLAAEQPGLRSFLEPSGREPTSPEGPRCSAHKAAESWPTHLLTRVRLRLRTPSLPLHFARWRVFRTAARDFPIVAAISAGLSPASLSTTSDFRASGSGFPASRCSTRIARMAANIQSLSGVDWDGDVPGIVRLRLHRYHTRSVRRWMVCAQLLDGPWVTSPDSSLSKMYLDERPTASGG